MVFNILAKNPGNWANFLLVWLLEASQKQWSTLRDAETPELCWQMVEE